MTPETETECEANRTKLMNTMKTEKIPTNTEAWRTAEGGGGWRGEDRHVGGGCVELIMLEKLFRTNGIWNETIMSLCQFS